eukprot:1160274-Pelagomonas_calceolata.AAC.3
MAAYTEGSWRACQDPPPVAHGRQTNFLGSTSCRPPIPKCISGFLGGRGSQQRSPVAAPPPAAAPARPA